MNKSSLNNCKLLCIKSRWYLSHKNWNIWGQLVAGVLFARKCWSAYRWSVSLLLHNGYQYPYRYPCTGTNVYWEPVYRALHVILGDYFCIKMEMEALVCPKLVNKYIVINRVAWSVDVWPRNRKWKWKKCNIADPDLWPYLKSLIARPMT